MQLTSHNIRPWARTAGWDRDAGYALKVIVHDEAFRCPDCNDLFSDYEDDGRELSHGWVCNDCASYYGKWRVA